MALVDIKGIYCVFVGIRTPGYLTLNTLIAEINEFGHFLPGFLPILLLLHIIGYINTKLEAVERFVFEFGLFLNSNLLLDHSKVLENRLCLII